MRTPRLTVAVFAILAILACIWCRIGPPDELFAASGPPIPSNPYDASALLTSPGAGSPNAWRPFTDSGLSTQPVRLTPIDSNTMIWFTMDALPAGTNTNQGNEAAITLTGAGGACAQGEMGLFNYSFGCVNQGASGAGVVSVNTDAGQSSSTAMTWSLWTYPMAFNTTNNLLFAKKTNVLGFYTGGEWALAISETTTSSYWLCWATAPGTTSISAGPTASGNTTGQLQLGQWQFLACTWDGTSLTSWYNGHNVGSLTAGDGGTQIGWADAGAYEVSYEHDATGKGYNGYIDDIRVEKTVRSAAYLTQQYQFGVFGSQQ